jgi:hypothetical protein
MSDFFGGSKFTHEDPEVLCSINDLIIFLTDLRDGNSVFGSVIDSRLKYDIYSALVSVFLLDKRIYGFPEEILRNIEYAEMCALV